MAKPLQEQIAELESYCNKLSELQKLFEKMVKNEFGLDAKKIHKILSKSDSSENQFQENIASYFSLKTEKDYADFISIFCTYTNLQHFKTMRNHDSFPDSTQG